MYFLSLDNNLNFSSGGESKPLVSDKDLDVVNYIQTKTNTFIFSSKKDSKNNVVKCYYQVFDKTTNSGKGDITLIGDISYKNSFAAQVSMSFILSPDSTKVVADLAPPRLNTDSTRREIIVFDNEMKVLWKKNISFPYLKNKSYYIRDVIVDNNGNAFMLYIEHLTEEGAGKEEIHNYKIMAFGNNGKTVTDKVIYNGKESLDKVKMMFLANGNISCSGILADHILIQYTGMYNILIDPATIDVLKFSFMKWDVNVMKAYESKSCDASIQKEIDKGRTIAISDCYLSDPVKTADGGLYITCEEMNDKTSSYNNPISSTGKSESTSYYLAM